MPFGPSGVVGSLFTINTTPHRVWVTSYDLAKTQHLDYGFMEAFLGGDTYTYRQWTSGNYYPPGVYYARGEVKDADNNTIYDTTIQVPPPLYVTYIAGDGNGNYWWVLGLP